MSNKDWYKAEWIKNVLRYTDSDGVWMEETFGKDGRIITRKNSFGESTRFVYIKDANGKIVDFKKVDEK